MKAEKKINACDCGFFFDGAYKMTGLNNRQQY